VLPSLVLTPHRELLCIQGSHPDSLGGQVPPPDQAVPWCLGGSILPVVWGMYPGNKEGEKTTVSTIPRISPQEMLWKTWTETQDSEARSNALLCQHRLSGLMSKGWTPRTKGSHLMYPCKQVTEATIFLKTPRFNPYLVICNSICYFTLVLIAPLPPVLCDLLNILDSLGFISLLYHPWPPATLSEHRTVCFSSGPPLCYMTITHSNHN
jgi:hypothetical protein